LCKQHITTIYAISQKIKDKYKKYSKYTKNEIMQRRTKVSILSRFKHLTSFDHGKIAALRAEGKSMQAIADAVGCHKSTISRELKRGTVAQMKTDGKKFEAYFPDTGQ
jgi:DNA-directed RNA polymerase specialized sigma54-like protein